MRTSSSLGGPLALVALLAAATAASAAEPPATVTLDGTVRDFRGYDLPPTGDLPRGHIDFENANGAETGIVAAQLGPDGLPVYAKHGVSSATTHGQAAFDQWFRDTPGINLASPLRLTLTATGDGRYALANPRFFPVDEAGFVAAGQEPRRNDSNGTPRNFSFTTEVHGDLLYRPGDVVRFTGDDDVWVFVNGRLAIDLGGVHGPASATVDLDQRAAALGIVPGRTYALDVFHAERHTSLSSYQLEVPRLGIEPGAPTIPATATVGEQVTCDPGTWPEGIALDYAWLRDGTPIADATAAAHTVGADDAGHALTCRVTGTGPRTTVSADSAALDVTERDDEPEPPGRPDVPAAPESAAPASPTPAAPPAPAPATPARICRSRRVVHLHLGRRGKHAPRSAVVRLGGRAVKVRRGSDGRLTATLDLRGRRAGTYAVRIRIVTKSGHVVRQVRRYTTCAR